jgi:hypothetical protein
MIKNHTWSKTRLPEYINLLIILSPVNFTKQRFNFLPVPSHLSSSQAEQPSTTESTAENPQSTALQAALTASKKGHVLTTRGY